MFVFCFFLKDVKISIMTTTAQPLRIMEKKESWAELSGDIKKMINKSFLGWGGIKS